MHPYVIALLGGALIGLSATILLAFNGRVAGISGIVGGLVPPAPDSGWRTTFVAGLVLAGFAWVPLLPEAFAPGDRSVFAVIVAGLLVGFGTRLGNGCTSGHGVCGMARFSKRSFAAVGVFLATGMVTATLFGWLTRGVT